MSDMPDRIWAYVNTDAGYPNDHWSDEYRDIGYREDQTEYVKAHKLDFAQERIDRALEVLLSHHLRYNRRIYEAVQILRGQM